MLKANITISFWKTSIWSIWKSYPPLKHSFVHSTILGSCYHFGNSWILIQLCDAETFFFTPGPEIPFFPLRTGCTVIRVLIRSLKAAIWKMTLISLPSCRRVARFPALCPGHPQPGSVPCIQFPARPCFSWSQDQKSGSEFPLSLRKFFTVHKNLEPYPSSDGWRDEFKWIFPQEKYFI